MAATKIAFAREHTGNRHIDAVQAATKQVAERVNGCPFLVGRLKSVSFVAGQRRVVNHGLGTPAACIVVRQNYDKAASFARLTESADASQAVLDQDNQLALAADANCTLDLWFYPRASQPITDPSTGQST